MRKKVSTKNNSWQVFRIIDKLGSVTNESLRKVEGVEGELVKKVE